jgi:hypothetical protein
MVTLQIVVDDELYFMLLKKKGTKRTWAIFLKEEIMDKK